MNWLDERTQLNRLLRFLKTKSVPNHKHTFWYLFGGLTLFCFVVQILTGLLLLLYYKPTPDAAYESVKYIIEEVPFGNLIRSLHIWCSHFMIVALSIHMFSVYFMKAYRRPREVMWLTGFLLLILTFAFGFTGYLLPWDTTAFFATQIGTEVPRSIPLVGESLVLLLRGGSEVDGDTLTRLFALHVAILPLIAVALVGLHLVLNQVLGTSKPIGVKEQGVPIPFLPNFLLRDWTAWLLGSLALVAVVVAFPWGLGAKADPILPAPPGVRPEWYFWSLWQFLKVMPGEVLSVSGALIVNIVVVIGGLLWFAVPFLDKKAAQEQKSLAFLLWGIVMIAIIIGMTLWGAFGQ